MTQIFESRKMDKFKAIIYWVFYLAVLPQVWSSDNDALHLREPFPGNFPLTNFQTHQTNEFWFDFQATYFRDFQSAVFSPDWRRATILGDRICRLSSDLSRRNTAMWETDEMRDKKQEQNDDANWWCFDAQVSKVGVFSCGPRAVTRANSRACEQVSNSIISIIINISVNNSIAITILPLNSHHGWETCLVTSIKCLSFSFYYLVPTLS